MLIYYLFFDYYISGSTDPNSPSWHVAYLPRVTYIAHRSGDVSIHMSIHMAAARAIPYKRDVWTVDDASPPR